MYKSKLQELCHQRAWDLPVYTTVKVGPDHCPSFTTTVTVNGVPFQSPQNQCNSSKESQNVAAQLAFDYFSSSSSSSQAVASPTSSGFAESSGNLLHKLRGNVQNSLANETRQVHKVESKPKDLLHVYKNQLQQYLQKRNLALPEYSYEFDGPPHARLFRASVVVDGITYRRPEYYMTLKDTEHAAAKVALESLSLGEIQEDKGLYKSLLQELAQKEGSYFPSYTTAKTGAPHMPTFVSTVKVGGETYQGQECKTKKQSEMSAAKVAYNSLMERRTVNNLPAGCSTKENMKVPSLSLQPVITDKSQPNMGAETTSESLVEVAVGRTGEMDGKSSVLSPCSYRKEFLEISSSSLDSCAIDLHQNIQPEPISAVEENLDAAFKGEETRAKRYRRSSPTENVHGSLPETSSPSCALPNTPSACSMLSLSAESDAAQPAGDNTPSPKILIFPRGSTMAIPEGASILPFSDDKWVATIVGMNQNQQPQ